MLTHMRTVQHATVLHPLPLFQWKPLKYLDGVTIGVEFNGLPRDLPGQSFNGTVSWRQAWRLTVVLRRREREREREDDLRW